MQPPSLDDVRAACARVYPFIRPTPLMRHPLLDAESGSRHLRQAREPQPDRPFKVRGGLNLIGSSRRTSAARRHHGDDRQSRQSIALACQREGVPCTIVTPVGNNPEKNAAMRAYGAEVIEYGRDFDEARERVEQLQAERGLRYVHSANEPLLIAGVGTLALEIFEAAARTST